MPINQSKLKSSKQLFCAIDALGDKKKEILLYSDESILRYIMDMDEQYISSEVIVEMTEVTEAYRITIAQLIDKEIERKAFLLDKIKLKDNEDNEESK